MFVPFVTIEGNTYKGWDVVEKSFPAQSAYTFAKRVLQHYSNQKEAETEAVGFAKAFNLTFVRENSSILLVAPHFGFYMAKLITPLGVVKEIGIKREYQEEAFEDAQKAAKEGDHVFLLSKPLAIN